MIGYDGDTATPVVFPSVLLGVTAWLLLGSLLLSRRIRSGRLVTGLMFYAGTAVAAMFVMLPLTIIPAPPWRERLQIYLHYIPRDIVLIWCVVGAITIWRAKRNTTKIGA